MLFVLLVCLAAVPAEPLTDIQFEKAVAMAVERECEEIETQIAAAKVKLKRRDRSRNAKRNKIVLKKQIKAAGVRVKQLRAGKLKPTMELNPFKLKVGQVGRLHPRGRENGDLRVVESSGGSVLVRCRDVVFSTRWYGGSKARRTMSPVVKWSQPFWLEGVNGTREEKISAPQCLWYVRRLGDTLRLVRIK